MMKLVKKTAEYSIYQRRDNRYAVEDGNKKAINGDDKVRILTEEGLVTAPVAAVVETPVEETQASEAVEAEGAAEEAPATEEAPAAEEAPATEEAPAAEEDAARE